VLVEDGKVAPKEIVNALRTQNSTVQVKETVKVDADRLDRLVEMIGELVIAESMVSQSSKSGQMGTSGFLRHLNELDKITRELQQMGMSLRMVPLRATFQKMARLVRDLSKKSGKQVEFVMAGEDTELDKTVVDRIGDPLVHMIRNAVDHGLEACPDDRVRAGKNATGRVELRAFHKGGNIYIEIQDDGRGLDRDAILAKGRERGLIADGETPSDRDIYNLIFHPGFSTAKKVTDVSGRGVGMDVVKRNIDSLRGQVEIRTEVGKGSTFSIRLPLTLAIIDDMVVRVGAERYIIPTLSVLISIRPEPSQLSTVLGRGQLLSHQGREIPLFRLDEVFHIGGAEKDPTKALAVVVEDDGRHVVLLVDELLGQQQIVIKSLGESVRGITGISGGAIMPDGKVGLILDVGGVIRLAQTGT
jgi:two-component system chemotaxis sensor kinase CheA